MAKILISGDVVKEQPKGRWPCAVCKRGVGNSSIQCSRCKNWCHKRCSKIKGSLKLAAMSFVCSSCVKVAEPNQTSQETVDKDIEQVNESLYLGDMLNNKGDAEIAIRNRIKVSWNKWRQISSILTCRSIPIITRCQLYDSVIRSVLLYGAETWPITQKLEMTIFRTDMKMLRWLHRIQLKDKITSKEILQRSKLEDIRLAISKRRLRWFGHAKRSTDQNVQDAMNLRVEGTKPRGRPKKTWMQTVLADMKNIGLEEADALDRKKWRSGCRNVYHRAPV